MILLHRIWRCNKDQDRQIRQGLSKDLENAVYKKGFCFLCEKHDMHRVRGIVLVRAKGFRDCRD